jgi:probable F420-dependent oxidoreductase
MRIGVVFPQTESGDDVGAIRAYAKAVESLGFTHVLSYDHVLGVDPSVREGFKGFYDVSSTFHEPFVFYGFLAGITDLELVTGIIILPQRQTALVAKQATEVDLLTGGHFRLGIGIGWNRVEYEALTKEFSNRGARSAEQVALLRRLFTEESVTFEGRFEQVRGAGLCPLPIQRPIPIWFGANSPAAWRRIGQLADGWFPQQRLGEGFEEAKAIVDAAAVAAGRDPAAIGMDARLEADAENLEELVAAWRAAGATHLSFNTMRAGHLGVDAHLEALRRAAAVAR